MNNIKFTINGFKCFYKEESFIFNKLTLFTGANSGGKSSVIQALILTKKESESNGDEVSFSDAAYALDLGSFDDVAYRDSRGAGSGIIQFCLDGSQWDVHVDDEVEIVKSPVVHLDNLKNLFSAGFSFLAADREAPRYVYEYSKSKVDLCNCHGGNVGDVLNKHGMDNVESIRSLNGRENKLKIILDEWVDYIFPGVAIGVEGSAIKKAESYQIVEHNKSAATNIGFGITYSLSILINGLLTKKEGWLVVENPEAHLHPKAQSNMGYFLACMASAGVRVVVETHSEHIVNGIRRFALKHNSQLKPDDVAIYFFKNNSGNREIEKIDIDENGNLSDLPVDFFDQVRQDMQKIIQLGMQKSKSDYD